MSEFKYRAVQTDGTIAEGQLKAVGRQEAYRQLEGRGLTPVRLVEARRPATSMKDTLRFELRRGKVSHKELENFTRQLSNLLAAGVPLSRSLQIICRESSTPAARDRWKAVHDLVIDGASLADAMARSPGTFPIVYVAMVRAGETGGFLDTVLAQIAEFQSRDKELRSKVISALIYPAVLLVLAVAVLIFLLVFFVPRFQTIFAGFGAALPWLTQLIVAASRALTEYGPFILVGVILAIVLIRPWLQTDEGRRRWQQLILRLPIIGPLNARFAMTRFCRMLGTLTGSGVPLINALQVARESIDNQTLTDAVTVSIERVRQGESLAAGLSHCVELFPGSVLEMISVSEETGQLDQELVRLATVSEKDLDRQLRSAIALAEPLMLFIMAGFIGTIFVGMVIPIFTIQDYIK